MKRCNACETVQKDNNKFCASCGASISDNFTYICDHCGKVFGANDHICPKCGTVPGITLSVSPLAQVQTDKNLADVKDNLHNIVVQVTNNIPSAKDKVNNGIGAIIQHEKIILVAGLILVLLISTFGSYTYFTKQNKQKELALQMESKITKIDQTTTKMVPLKNMATIAAESAQLRNKASLLGVSLQRLSRGTKVEVLGKDTCQDNTVAMFIQDAGRFNDSKDGVILLVKGTPLKITQLIDTRNVYECDFTATNGKEYRAHFSTDQIKMMKGTLWYKVKFNNNTGWIYGEELILDQE